MKTIATLTLTFLLFCPLAQAKTYTQKDDLYQIDLPPGWTMSGTGPTVEFLDSSHQTAIVITTSLMGQELERAQADRALQMIDSNTIENLKRNGPDNAYVEILQEGSSTIDGAPARRIDYMLTQDKHLLHCVRLTAMFQNHMITIKAGYPAGKSTAQDLSRALLSLRIRPRPDFNN